MSDNLKLSEMNLDELRGEAQGRLNQLHSVFDRAQAVLMEYYWRVIGKPRLEEFIKAETGLDGGVVPGAAVRDDHGSKKFSEIINKITKSYRENSDGKSVPGTEVPNEYALSLKNIRKIQESIGKVSTNSGELLRGPADEKPKEKPCPECGGQGGFPMWRPEGLIMARCYFCKGTGKVPAEGEE